MSSIGTKIRKLREERLMSQNELAIQLGISQSKLHNVESGFSQKIDFLLMDKISKFFDKDLSYFIEDKIINNHVKENKGQISCDNVTINNNYPDVLLRDLQKLIDENKMLKNKLLIASEDS
jgi:transcriptional regulator with XRE-family HTH domain